MARSKPRGSRKTSGPFGEMVTQGPLSDNTRVGRQSGSARRTNLPSGFGRGQSGATTSRRMNETLPARGDQSTGRSKVRKDPY